MRKPLGAAALLGLVSATVALVLILGGGSSSHRQTILALRACNGSGSKRVRFNPAVIPRCPGSSVDAIDAANFDAALATRLGATPNGYARAIAARAKLAKQKPVPGGRNAWKPAATGPLIANSPAYPDSAANGDGYLSGRVGSFAYDAGHSALFAAASQGGVWMSNDLGASWRSIGGGLPTQIVGAVGYTRAGGSRAGTLIAATGDNAFGAYTYGGLGAYWSANDGRSWHRAKGIPNGALSFRVATDPVNANVIYIASGLGLYRSADAGRSYVNVALPTGRCAGNSLLPDCFLANVVTDVVVQAPDKYGHAGGAVLAAVGWRAGAHPDANGSPESPANGLYSSSTGMPGSFQNVSPSGFTPQPLIGRVALGVATGPDQNHNYIYAEVQDTKLFIAGKIGGLDVPSLPDPLGLGIDPTKTKTVLNGVYVSSDFGRTWKQMESGTQFGLPGNGSTLTGNPGFELLGNYGPGIQSWYNEWIAPDPTLQSGGVPTRVVAGLEELWQTSSQTKPANGAESFTALTPYNGNKSPDCILVLLQQLVCQNLPQKTVTAVHPDQHAGIFIPAAGGGETLVIGNDGGIYRQQLGQGQALSAAGFGLGSQTGLQTLEPYGVSMSGDGTIYAGLQDNGNAKIGTTGQQFETLGGDGIFTAVDPTNSKIAYDTLPGGTVFVTTDGGFSWRDASPGATNAPFYTPLGMDPLNPKQLLTGGRGVFDSVAGSKTAFSSNGATIDPATNWQSVFDLGTRQNPGSTTDPGSSPADAQNQVSAVAVRGPNAYVGYCGDCDPVKDNSLFGNGIATNVGATGPTGPIGSSGGGGLLLGGAGATGQAGGATGNTGPPIAGSPSGWHIAAAKGLPKRIITSVAIDPANPNQVFVTLGSSTLRPYVPAGRLGNDGVSLQAGSVYESLDAGQTFTDVSGNMPQIGAAWVGFHRSQLVVADTVGVFASRQNVSTTRVKPLSYGVLGRGLPVSSVFSFTFNPAYPDELVAATFGRGVWKYYFSRR
ncbi:MAG: hypothetical protein ACYDHH_24010 [Solirubrobacteraceae bacterium]